MLKSYKMVKPRGFAFMTYKTVEAARKALADPNKTIEARLFSSNFFGDMHHKCRS